MSDSEKLTKLIAVIDSWDAWANSASADERNRDLQACVAELKQAAGNA